MLDEGRLRVGTKNIMEVQAKSKTILCCAFLPPPDGVLCDLVSIELMLNQYFRLFN